MVIYYYLFTSNRMSSDLSVLLGQLQSRGSNSALHIQGMPKVLLSGAESQREGLACRGRGGCAGSSREQHSELSASSCPQAPAPGNALPAPSTGARLGAAMACGGGQAPCSFKFVRKDFASVTPAIADHPPSPWERRVSSAGCAS